VILPACLVAGLAGLASDTPTPGIADGISTRVAQAYQAAAGRCPGLDWTLLAAIGGVESHHGTSGGATVDPITGEARPWIFGPQLDGTAETAAMPIGPWVGWWGLTGPWQRAVGPMQFLASTFTTHAVDADHDGTTNPHDFDDAAATTAAYICAAAGAEVDGVDEIARIYNPGDTSATPPSSRRNSPISRPAAPPR
jgi:membrane-bound lytic murein transglycosylase B